MKQKRSLAVVLAGVVFMTFLVSAGVLAVCTDHDCIGEGCTKCAQICLAKETIEHIIAACGGVLCLLPAMCCQPLDLGNYSNPCIRSNTLIKLKVKLSD